MKNEAQFSTDTLGPDKRGQYRFTLWRHDLQAGKSLFSGGICQFVCLNPSTADEQIEKTKGGQPRHPLYLKSTLKPIRFQ